MMKINKLKTSRQFGLWLKCMTMAEFIAFHGMNLAGKSFEECKYNLRNLYDSKINKLLKYNMFINSLNEPIRPPLGMSYLPFSKEMEEYNQAQKELLFFPKRIEHGKNIKQHTINIVFDEYTILIMDDDSFYIRLCEPYGNLNYPIKTLEDLAFFTKGQLETRNFELC